MLGRFIPDEKRTRFKTRNNRVVLDGGGVKPDIIIDELSDAAIVKGLIQQHVIFDYVTQFCLQHDSIGAVQDFNFEQFDEFVTFIEGKDFSYNTDSEKLIKKLEKESKKEGYDLSSQIQALRSEIESSKKNALVKNKDIIIDMIEKEIASRYHYQEGKIKMSLRNDKEIQDAIKLMNDKAAYDKVLAGQ